VVVGGKDGYIDVTGKLVINPQYDNLDDFSEGLAKVCLGECSIDYLVGYRYTKDYATREDLAQTFKYGFIDESGKVVINPTFEDANKFSEGMAAVCVGRGCYTNNAQKHEGEAKWGFIDTSGKMVIAPQFDRGFEFHEGLAVVSVGGKYGYIDKSGRFAISPIFDFAMLFDGGVAQVSVKESPKDNDKGAVDKYKYGYIDKTGKYIWQPSN
jgi:hypothetical protein